MPHRCLGIVLACAVATVSVGVADDSLSEQKLNALKAATVYVKVDGRDGLATGSGFLILVNGDSGLVATNRHVIGGGSGGSTQAKVSLVFFSGTKKEMTLPAEVVAADAEADLAILKVSSKSLPAPFDLGQAAKPRETMPVYSLGFPLGDLLASNKGNPALTIAKGTVSSLREDERGKLQRIQLDGELNPGNSGGPIVDADGKLVGIAVSKITNTKIGFAIPPAELTDILKGRVAALNFRSIRVNNGEAQLEIEVPCVDPLHKIKSVELRLVRKDAIKESLLAAKEGVWPELPGSEKVTLQMDDGKGKATVTLKSADKKMVDYVFQTAYTVGDARAVVTQPLTKGINFAANGLVAQDDGKSTTWETITSKEGNFTVDMPAKPQLQKSKTRKIGGATVKMLMFGTFTETGGYLVYRIDVPNAIEKGTENAQLDASRDSMADEFNGKVVSEKKVRAGNTLGRDFTIKGKPDDAPGVILVRMRQYLIGRSIYAVMVVSPPNHELPLDAGRFLGSLAIGEAMKRAAGTPEPEPTGTEIKGWGLAIDPKKDCKITPVDKSVTIEVPGVFHDLNADNAKLDAPRLMREVDGDFVLTAKVTGEFKPGPKSTNPKVVPYLGAGILIWSDSDNYIRFERASMLRDGKHLHSIRMEEREGGYPGAIFSKTLKADDYYIRLERKGSRINGFISADGKAWERLPPIDTVWPSKLKVGLSVVTSSSEPVSIKFEEVEFKAKGGDAEKK